MGKFYLESFYGPEQEEISNPSYFNDIVNLDIIMITKIQILSYTYHIRIISYKYLQELVKKSHNFSGVYLSKYIILKDYDETEIEKQLKDLIKKCNHTKTKNLEDTLNKFFISEEEIYLL